MVQSGPRGLGQNVAKSVSSVIGGGLLTAANLSPEPVSKAFLYVAAGLASVVSQLFKFGYDPKKLNDTAITEAFRISFNQVWEQLTGERLPYACDPGQCGKQGQAIFTGSAWPAVPYPSGRPGTDPTLVLSAIDTAAAEGRSKLVRPESRSGFDGNVAYARSIVEQVAARRAEEMRNPLTAAGAAISSAVGGADLMSLLPWALGGFLVYKVIS
jgi:hypothetical protein